MPSKTNLTIINKLDYHQPAMQQVEFVESQVLSQKIESSHSVKTKKAKKLNTKNFHKKITRGPILMEYKKDTIPENIVLKPKKTNNNQDLEIVEENKENKSQDQSIISTNKYEIKKKELEEAALSYQKYKARIRNSH